MHELKLFEDNCIDSEQVVLEVFAVTEELSIDSEKVTEMVEPIETDDAESDGEVELTVGEVVSVVVLSVVVSSVVAVVVLSLEVAALSSLLQEMTVRPKRDMRIMYKILFIYLLHQ